VSAQAPTAAEISELLAHWWYRYDEGRVEELTGLLTEDATFRVRTDTGTTDYEEFVRADFAGPEEIVFWQAKHRAASPYPLRHMTLNVAVDRADGTASDFTSYLFVTQVVGGMPSPLPGGVVRGTVDRTGDGLKLSAFELTLDTQDSIPLEDRP
jgi:SnoaL-like domain